ncbi:hypothetical protein I4F81_002027 [Pyropia yezoensis]|uniref:Uncharacterized protein n=1 Tax=Pyropia yezoensis TaxID=2788 RepID=A0ACC3BPL2_PYRYE|nr:hypothetical protein I4F81_002027 [Neopyropia yezoensis]
MATDAGAAAVARLGQRLDLLLAAVSSPPADAAGGLLIDDDDVAVAAAAAAAPADRALLAAAAALAAGDPLPALSHPPVVAALAATAAATVAATTTTTERGGTADADAAATAFWTAQLPAYVGALALLATFVRDNWTGPPLSPAAALLRGPAPSLLRAAVAGMESVLGVGAVLRPSRAGLLADAGEGGVYGEAPQVLAVVWVEAAHTARHVYDADAAADAAVAAADALGVRVRLSGALGVRTKYQVRPLAQLTAVVLRRDPAGVAAPMALGEPADGAAAAAPPTTPPPDGDWPLPADVPLDDTDLLGYARLGGGAEDDPPDADAVASLEAAEAAAENAAAAAAGNAAAAAAGAGSAVDGAPRPAALPAWVAGGALSPVEQAVVLAAGVAAAGAAVGTDTMAVGERAAYAARVAAEAASAGGEASSMVLAHALLVRSDGEAARGRFQERVLAQTEAVADFQQPENGQAWNNLGRALVECGPEAGPGGGGSRDAAALSAMREAAKRLRDAPEVWDNVVTLAVRTGATEALIGALDALMDLSGAEGVRGAALRAAADQVVARAAAAAADPRGGPPRPDGGSRGRTDASAAVARLCERLLRTLRTATGLVSSASGVWDALAALHEGTPGGSAAAALEARRKALVATLATEPTWPRDPAAWRRAAAYALRWAAAAVVHGEVGGLAAAAGQLTSMLAQTAERWGGGAAGTEGEGAEGAGAAAQTIDMT